MVELFTSQGCSSCPPANANLAVLSERPGVLALSFGVTYWDQLGWKDTFAKPELVAPGRHIGAPLPAGTTLDLLAPAANRIAPGYATINGTSFAAPQVAGAAAIVFGAHPTWSPDNVKWALIAKSGPRPSASSISFCLTDSTSSDSAFAFARAMRIRSTAQKRLTAVGRVASITLHMCLKSNSRSAMEVPTD